MNRVTRVLILLRILGGVIAEQISGCDFYNTVNLTGIEPINESYVYKNVAIPRNRTGEYNYTTALFSGKKPVPNHLRGCLCEFAQCVLFCCEPTQDLPNAYVTISFDDNDKTVNVLEEYVVQPKFPQSCDTFYVDKKEIFAIQKNGNLISYTKNKEYSKEDYCLVPVKINDTYYELWHPTIKTDVYTQTKITLSSVLRSVSIFCMIMVISVYIYLPKFRTDYNNCCLCYFICLTISYTLLWTESIVRNISSSIICYFMGYFGYYTVMATFLWLVVINFNLWRNISRLQISSSEKFRKHNIFVWGVAAVLFAITGTVEYVTRNESVDSSWRPGVGLFYCWINTTTWSAMLYYYGPISIMLTIIIVLSGKTAKHIYVENKKMRSVWKTPESQSNATNHANFGMFFRLFTIAGVVWIIDIIAYIFDISSSENENYIDLIPSSQGILLFFVTIWKKDVLKLVFERMENGVKNRDSRVISSQSEPSFPLSATDAE